MMSSTLMYIAVSILGISIIVGMLSALITDIVKSIKQKEVFFSIYLIVSFVLTVLVFASIILHMLGM
ncbi:hypothetical protein BH792_gp128 [Staphylococcus phage Stau2]|uniref:Uncharacterized protein n=4 Tax=Silviavirus TaxID=1857889 RepID=A0A0U1ZWN0_9CAUD|nr:hypothetical protein O151_gp066 [Staphylococcus phage vB_SauM_Remus]YP_009275884.1 hypothetical protein BH792_gp128 [Staphylococcus phage Stau2]APC43018.1 hypothetical protein SAP1_153 [Staphylococcus phage StAP1]QXV86216.1 hypothetical protein [Staphylococcus phage SAPYZU_15]UGL60813.1 hypothetical protein [Staphylococcus phage vB_SauM-HM01]WBF47845.1 hypothetical protein SSP49_20 [Staphylococcus phage SSP49]BEU75281.1 hypothetical protein RNIID_0690 [Staphylococcus phage phiRNIID]